MSSFSEIVPDTVIFDDFERYTIYFGFIKWRMELELVLVEMLCLIHWNLEMILLILLSSS